MVVPQVQRPPLQVSLVPQTLPQAPQFVVLEPVAVHEPLQHSFPAPVHASPAPMVPLVPPQVQAPPLHVSPAPHTLPHAPQFEVLLAGLTQPVLQHSGVPPVQTSPPPTEPIVPAQVQRPALQVSPAPQVTPQAPQLVVLVCRLTHAFPQQSGVAPEQASPVAELGPAPHWQSPTPLQLSLGPQAVPQAPQFTVLNGVSQPFVRPPLQSRKFGSHDE